MAMKPDPRAPPREERQGPGQEQWQADQQNLVEGGEGVEGPDRGSGGQAEGEPGGPGGQPQRRQRGEQSRSGPRDGHRAPRHSLQVHVATSAATAASTSASAQLELTACTALSKCAAAMNAPSPSATGSSSDALHSCSRRGTAAKVRALIVSHEHG